MPFRLRNAAQTFKRSMDVFFRDLDFTYVYLDDIDSLEQTGLVLNGCRYAVEEIDFLSHRINQYNMESAECRKGTNDSGLPLTHHCQRTTISFIVEYHGRHNLLTELIYAYPKIFSQMERIAESTMHQTLCEIQVVLFESLGKISTRLCSVIALKKCRRYSSNSLTTAVQGTTLRYFTKPIRPSLSKFVSIDRVKPAFMMKFPTPEETVQPDVTPSCQQPPRTVRFTLDILFYLVFCLVSSLSRTSIIIIIVIILFLFFYPRRESV